MPLVKKVVRYKVVKNGHTPFYLKRSQQHEKEHTVCHMHQNIIDVKDT